MQKQLFTKTRWLVTIILLLSLSVGQMWGTVDATYTLSTSDNNTSNITVGSTTWAVGASAIAESSSKCKLTGIITVSLPTGAVLKSTTLTGNGNGWGSGAKVIFKAGSTSLNEFASCTTYTLTSNKTNGTYSYTKGGTSSKNAWVKSIKVTYYPQTVVTLDKNGGSEDGSATFSYDATGYTTFSGVTRDGYTCTGYWTTGSGSGTKILNADGSKASTSISDWWSNNKWCKDAASATLYARWESAGTSVTLSKAASSNGSLFCTALCALLSL